MFIFMAPWRAKTVPHNREVFSGHLFHLIVFFFVAVCAFVCLCGPPIGVFFIIIQCIVCCELVTLVTLSGPHTSLPATITTICN